MEVSSIKKYVAEFIGTAILVTFGCGVAAALVCDGNSPDAAYLMTALTFGLVIVAMAYSIGNISGCHINPAVSLGVFLRGGMSAADFGGYLVAQFLGGICGAIPIGMLLGFNCGMGANALYGDNVLLSVIAEVILTFVFVIAVLGATDKIENSSVAGLVIGLSLTLVHLFGIHFTGTSVNPARSFGPALFAGGAALSNVWVFIVAPLAGGALAAVVYNFLTGPKAE